jgi:hypothetical protein
MFPGFEWLTVKDGDPRAYALMRRHYTFHDYKDNRRRQLNYRNRNLFAGPGEKLVLITPDLRGLFVWRKFIDLSGQSGVNCAVFRNESTLLSSDLIRAAMILAWERWPGERLYTYVNQNKIKSSNPGYCFKQAGWTYCGTSKKLGLHILEVYPQSVQSVPEIRCQESSKKGVIG